MKALFIKDENGDIWFFNVENLKIRTVTGKKVIVHATNKQKDFYRTPS